MHTLPLATLGFRARRARTGMPGQSGAEGVAHTGPTVTLEQATAAAAGAAP